MKPKKLERVSCFKMTDDDWYPSYKLQGYHAGTMNQKLVTVTFLQFPDGGGYRCCVWGQDDCGMDFDHEDRNLVWFTFMDVLFQEKVNKGFLKDRGFVPA